MESASFYSHGKLLITGEYLVLDGAMALAVPTRLGQSLTVIHDEMIADTLEWKSNDQNGDLWFSGRFTFPHGVYLQGEDDAVGRRLEQLFKAGKELGSPLFREGSPKGFKVRTDLEFPRNWGLGTSSTLINNLAKWWQVDPYRLLAKTFGGSGYDLACADADSAIFYRREAGQPIVQAVSFNPPFADRLYFLYLEQKQDSRAGIARYRQKGGPDRNLLDLINGITQSTAATTSFSEFCELLTEHEALIGGLIDLLPVKERLFPDFPGLVKSLGAWGGDFVLIASDLAFDEIKNYFQERGFTTLLAYRELVHP